MTRIAIIGRTEFLYEITKFLIHNQYNISIIITSKSEKHYQIKECDYKKLAKDNNVDFIFTNKINNLRIINILKKKKIDIGISMNGIEIFGEDFINSFKSFILNIHCGDLPKYQGNACPNWAILNGEKKIGLTIHKMLPNKIDEGDFLKKSYFKIKSSTYISDIYSWMMSESVTMINSIIKMFEKKNLKWKKMNNSTKIRCFPRLPIDSKINWNSSTENIYRLIRSFSEPFEGSYCFLNQNKSKIRIFKALPYNILYKFYAVPGQVLFASNGCPVIATGDGALKLTNVKFKKFGNLESKKIILKSLRNRLN